VTRPLQWPPAPPLHKHEPKKKRASPKRAPPAQNEARAWLDEDGRYSIFVKLAGVPLPPNEVVGKSRMKSYRNSVTWRQRAYLMAGRLAPKKPLTHARITLKRYGSRWLDYDGLVGSFKPVVDGFTPIREKAAKGTAIEDRHLVWPGVLIDDCWKVTGPWVVDQEVVPLGGEYITILIEEIPGRDPQK